MMEYAIEEAADPDRLEELVNARLRDGWQLQGGVSSAVYTTEDRDGCHETHWWYVQALTRSGADA